MQRGIDLFGIPRIERPRHAPAPAQQTLDRLRRIAEGPQVAVVEPHPHRVVLGSEQPQLAGQIEDDLILQPQRSGIVDQVEHPRSVDQIAGVEPQLHRLLDPEPVPGLAAPVAQPYGMDDPVFLHITFYVGALRVAVELLVERVEAVAGQRQGKGGQGAVRRSLRQGETPQIAHQFVVEGDLEQFQAPGDILSAGAAVAVQLGESRPGIPGHGQDQGQAAQDAGGSAHFIEPVAQ